MDKDATTVDCHEADTSTRNRRRLLARAGMLSLAAAPLALTRVDTAAAATADTAVAQTWTATQTFQADVIVNGGADLMVSGSFGALSANAVSPTAGPTTPAIPAGTPGVSSDEWGVVRMGANALGPTGDPAGWGNHNNYVPEFLYDASARRVRMRSLMLTEVGDPVDLAIGKYGPDNAYPGSSLSSLEAVTSGANLGNIYFWGAVPRSSGPGASLQSRSVNIAAKAAEDFTNVAGQYSTGGHLVISVTPIGEHLPVERMRIHAQGQVLIGTDTPFTSDIDQPSPGRVPNGSLHVKDEIRSAGPIYANTGLAQVAIGGLGPNLPLSTDPRVPAIAFKAGTSGGPGPMILYAHPTSGLVMTPDFAVRFGDSGKQVSMGGVGPGSAAGVKFRPSGPALYAGSDTRITTGAQLQALDGLATRVVSGTVSDSSFSSTATPPNGTIVLDGDGLAVRVGGTWKHATLS